MTSVVTKRSRSEFEDNTPSSPPEGYVVKRVLFATNDSDSVSTPPMPKTPSFVYTPAFDLSDWFALIRNRPKEYPSRKSDVPSLPAEKIPIPRGKSPIGISQLAILSTKRLLESSQRTNPKTPRAKLSLDQTCYSGLLLLDCDRTILSYDKNATSGKWEMSYRPGLREMFEMCDRLKVKVGLLSSAGRTTLDKYTQLLKKDLSFETDIIFSIDELDAFLPKTGLDSKGNKIDFYVKVLSLLVDDATLTRTIYVDDMLVQIVANPDNCFLAREFFADMASTDRFLYKLNDELEFAFRTEGDLREVVRMRNGLRPLMDAICRGRE